MPRDKMTIHFAPVVVNTGNKLVLIDTGNGPGEYVNPKGRSANSYSILPPRASIPR